jgi:hypothetical protein
LPLSFPVPAFRKIALAAASFFGDNRRHAQEVRAVKLKVAFTSG